METKCVIMEHVYIKYTQEVDHNEEEKYIY